MRRLVSHVHAHLQLSTAAAVGAAAAALLPGSYSLVSLVSRALPGCNVAVWL